jgi:hypothetical protein
VNRREACGRRNETNWRKSEESDDPKAKLENGLRLGRRKWEKGIGHGNLANRHFGKVDSPRLHHTPAMPTQFQRLHPALVPQIGPISPIRPIPKPPPSRNPLSHRGGAFSAPCALFPTVGTLFPFRARFFRSVRAFSDPCALFPLRVRFLQSGRKSPPTSSPHHKSPIPRLPSLFLPFLHSSLPYSQSLPPPHQSREAQPSTGQSREAKPFTRHNNRVRQSLLRDPTPHPSPRP